MQPVLKQQRLSNNHRPPFTDEELVPAFELFIEELLTTQAWQVAATNDRLIDSVPVMLARGTRANRARVAAELANTGVCVTKQEYCRGIKLQFIAARRSKQFCRCQRRFHLSTASLHDLAALREVRRVCPRAALCSPTKPISMPGLGRSAKSVASFWSPLTSHPRAIRGAVAGEH